MASTASTDGATGHAFLDDGGPVLAFAHRGGARHPELLGLENTLAAFRHAVALGYRYLETDVHLTADGVLVAFHDTVLERVTDGEGRIEDLAWSDLAGVRTKGVREPGGEGGAWRINGVVTRPDSSEKA